jgi:hypothetical protein
MERVQLYVIGMHFREIEYQDHDPALGQKSGLDWPSSDELMLFA